MSDMYPRFIKIGSSEPVLRLYRQDRFFNWQNDLVADVRLHVLGGQDDAHTYRFDAGEKGTEV